MRKEERGWMRWEREREQKERRWSVEDENQKPFLFFLSFPAPFQTPLTAAVAKDRDREELELESLFLLSLLLHLEKGFPKTKKRRGRKEKTREGSEPLFSFPSPFSSSPPSPLLPFHRAVSELQRRGPGFAQLVSRYLSLSLSLSFVGRGKRSSKREKEEVDFFFFFRRSSPSSTN